MMTGELETNMKRYATILGVCAAICMTGYFATSFRILFLSLLAGLAAGLVNLVLNFLDAKIIGHVALKKNRIMSLLVGFNVILRILIPVAVVYLALIFPQWLDVRFVLVGFSSVYAMLFIDSVRKFFSKER